ncbi:FACT complex subunit SSRP1-like isoform X2 [Wolffia australiana]
MKVPRGYQLSVRVKDGLCYKFIGFREQDVGNLISFIQKTFGITTEEKQLAVSGQNWGDVDISGNMLTFMVGSKQAFEVCLADVAQTQLQGKTDVYLELHVDDTTAANEKDSLVDLSFYVPNSSTQFIGDENRPAAQVFLEKISAMADVASSSEEAVATFEGIAILTPRGRYSIDLHLSFLRLQGQANDFKIQYSSIVRIFLLPKANQPHTLVVATLDPPIRKGQTMYPHIVMQFETDYVIESNLALSKELLASKYKDKLEPSYKGLIHEVFAVVLRGLSGAKVTRPGKFRSSHDGFAVKSSLKAEDGLLYPLEKGFFFLPKPPTLILHDEIDWVEFERHGAGSTSVHYFDLFVKLKSEQDYLFRNIQKSEYSNLFNFISGKGLKILNLGEGKHANGEPQEMEDEDDAVDPHLARIQSAAADDESDEEDEDFVADKDDGGSPTDDSDAIESGSDSERKNSPAAPRTAPKRRSKEGNEEEKRKRRAKKTKKKDPDAPKRAMSGFMFFSNSERDNIKKANPAMAFTDLGRALGERWNKMTADEKEPYESLSRADQKRYKAAMAGYRSAADGEPRGKI